jgi:hypothetical protein
MGLAEHEAVPAARPPQLQAALAQLALLAAPPPAPRVSPLDVPGEEEPGAEEPGWRSRSLQSSPKPFARGSALRQASSGSSMTGEQGPLVGSGSQRREAGSSTGGVCLRLSGVSGFQGLQFLSSSTGKRAACCCPPALAFCLTTSPSSAWP